MLQAYDITAMTNTEIRFVNTATPEGVRLDAKPSN